MKFDVQKLKISPYRMVQSYFDILNHLGVAQECDRQTDRQTDEKKEKWFIAYSSSMLDCTTLKH